MYRLDGSHVLFFVTLGSVSVSRTSQLLIMPNKKVVGVQSTSTYLYGVLKYFRVVNK